MIDVTDGAADTVAETDVAQGAQVGGDAIRGG